MIRVGTERELAGDGFAAYSFTRLKLTLTHIPVTGKGRSDPFGP